MKGFCLFIAVRLANIGLDAIKKDINESIAKNVAPITFWILGGAIVGAVISGFFGAIIGGVAGAVMSDALRRKAMVS
jgi:outer membrane lipoprotein SlyB